MFVSVKSAPPAYNRCCYSFHMSSVKLLFRQHIQHASSPERSVCAQYKRQLCVTCVVTDSRQPLRTAVPSAQAIKLGEPAPLLFPRLLKIEGQPWLQQQKLGFRLCRNNNWGSWNGRTDEQHQPGLQADDDSQFPSEIAPEFFNMLIILNISFPSAVDFITRCEFLRSFLYSGSVGTPIMIYQKCACMKWSPVAKACFLC